MKFSLLFCTTVFGSALIVTACAEKLSDRTPAPQQKDVVAGRDYSTTPHSETTLSSAITVDLPTAEKPPIYVDDSCYVVKGCPAIIENYYEKKRNVF